MRGAKIIIAEDVVTTGKSTLETKKCLEELGGEVIGVAIVVFVGRMFNNLGSIRRYYIEKWTSKKEKKGEKATD